MRHGKKFNHLSRKSAHRKAMLSNMATSLILHKRITTTVPKAKALRKYVEPLLTKSKEDTTHSRRTVFSYLQNKESVQTLFDDVASHIAERPGGYTRILKTGYRLGDNAEMCIIELVDYNELMLQEEKASKSKTRRSRRGGKKSTDAEAKQAEAAAPEMAAEEETPEAATVAPEVEEPEATAVPEVEEPEVEEAQEEKSEETPKAEAKVSETPEAEETNEKENDSDEDQEEEKK